LENALLAALVESSDDAIVSKTLDGIVTSWNRAAERLFGYAAAEMIGRPIALLAPAGREDEMPAILERIRRGEQIHHFETVRRRKDGTLVEVSLTISPIRDARGRLAGASKIARDITERRRAERERELRLDELRHPRDGGDGSEPVEWQDPLRLAQHRPRLRDRDRHRPHRHTAAHRAVSVEPAAYCITSAKRLRMRGLSASM
jgi:PAS domain S-box-containing protein